MEDTTDASGNNERKIFVPNKPMLLALTFG
jgi:hypothetical protein